MSISRSSLRLFQHHRNLFEKLGYDSPLDIAACSFSTFRQQCWSMLSYSEARALYREAKNYRQHLQAETRKVLTHSNPQLKNIRHLAIDPLQKEARDYESLFGQRSDVYVPQSSVASMFSPAAYLTELYREGTKLHGSDKPQYLDKRRPDLQLLALSQSNQDTELTTLALSNEILMDTIKAYTGKNVDAVHEALTNTFYPFDLPYHMPFSGIAAALAAQNTSVESLAQNLIPSQSTGVFPTVTRAAYANNLSPGLCNLLLAPLPDDETDLNNMLLDHFGTNDIVLLSDAEFFCRRAGINRDQLNTFLALPSFQQTNYAQNNHNVHVPLLRPPHQFGSRYLNATSTEWLGYQHGKLVRIVVNAPDDILLHLNILPSINDSCIKFAAVSNIVGENPATYIDIKIDEEHLTDGFPDTVSDGHGCASVPLHDGYRVFEVTVIKSGYKLQIGVGDQNIYNPGAWFPPSSPTTDNFSVTFSPVDARSLIKLSQLIRYAYKTNLSPAALDSLIVVSQKHIASPPTITEDTLLLTARALEYQQRYALNEDDTLVLAGADINPYAPAGELSQFDRLFNPPSLNRVAFTTNDTISLDATDTSYVQERAVLKRALGVDDAGLTMLAAIAGFDEPAWECSLVNLSMLYRVGLWARVHGLNPQELQRLLQLNGKTKALLSSSYAVLANYLDAIYCTSQWLVTQQLSVAELSMMTSNVYPDTMTPEIEGFIRTLYQAMKGGEVACAISLTTPEIDLLHQQFAPHIAAAFGLDNVDSALALQVWIEQIAADQGLHLTSIDAFSDAIVSYCESNSPTSEESGALATFSQALGQLAFIIQRWKLSPAALRVAVYQPSTLQSNLGDKLALTLNTQQALGRFKALQLCASDAVGECLTLLESNKLNAPSLARWLNVPESEVKLAATCVGADAMSGLNASQAALVVDWLAQAARLSVSVKTVENLLTSHRNQSYHDWQNVAGALLAGVPDPVRGQTDTTLDEELSTALCAYFQNTVAPCLPGDIPIKNRDDLFCYLLIDNQVSGHIITTRIAEAIASVQLYINRCLQGVEVNIERNLLTESFFAQWDLYNKRYSTWAGVSKLAYYPENYVDPTLRYNQSGLQQQLLNELNQSQLNKESVETAYLNYLNGFEDVANLKVLCGYHHAKDMDTGLSFFVGRSNTTPYRYYWRSLNHEAHDGVGGYVASAWTDWEEIQGQVNPINDEVRPVIFNNRLYIAWVAQQIVTAGIDSNGEPIQKAQYSLQLSYRKINGSWAPAMSFPIFSQVNVVDDDGNTLETLPNTGITPTIWKYDSTQFAINLKGDVTPPGDFINVKVDGVDINPDVPNTRAPESLDKWSGDNTYFFKPANAESFKVKVSTGDENFYNPEALTDTFSGSFVTYPDVNINSLNLYLSYNPLQDAILYMLYKPGEPSHYDGSGSIDDGEGPAYGGFIYNTMQCELVNGNDWIPVYSFFSNNLNTTSVPNKLIRHINTLRYSATVTESTAVDATDPDFLEVDGVSVEALVDNETFPASLEYILNTTLKTKGKTSAINTPGTVVDNGPDYLSVLSASVTDEVIEDAITFSASMVIQTTNGGRSGSVRCDITKPGEGTLLIYRADLQEDNTLRVDFKLSVPDHYDYKIVNIKNVTSGNVVYDSVIVDADGIIEVPFFEYEPSYTNDGLVVYRIRIGQVDHWGTEWELTLEYGQVYFPPPLEFSFAGKSYSHPRQPGGKFTLPALKHLITQGQDGSPIKQQQTLKITDGNAAWAQDFTLGLTTTTFAYNWGEGDIALPSKGVTMIAEHYVIDIPANGLSKDPTLTIKQDGTEVYKQKFTINVTKDEDVTANPTDYIQIIDGNNQASYLENTTQPKRIRLNTLFAHELVSRAQAGLDNVLSWGTQQLPEPKLGRGSYIDITFPAYDKELHGDGWFILKTVTQYPNNSRIYTIVYSGWVKSDAITVKIFLPWGGDVPGGIYGVSVTYSDYHTDSTYKEFDNYTWNDESNNFEPNPPYFNNMRGVSTSVSAVQTEPMDFSGANGLYFWELFYYTPMMAAEKLLQSQDFEEAERWLKYVFNPQGYLEEQCSDQHYVDRKWNARPLEEDTAWDETQTDSTDPDVVAQADPMHYKVTTFMKLLDLLIARGDMAYRQLERDTLAEAKMWYLSALQLLGPQPDLPKQGNWSDPTLSLAASDTAVQQNLMLMGRLVQGEVTGGGSQEARTANSLTALFLPSENDKFNGYWQTMEQRLFNLRHNLSIDGQPLTLPLYATPADPRDLQSAAAASAGGGNGLPGNTTIAIQRFPVMLESARSLVGQLIQYGSTLISVLERKDSEALSALLQTQAQDLMQRSLQLQEKTIEQLQADLNALSASQNAAAARRDSYQTLLNDGVSDIERQSINERIASGSMSMTANGMRVAGAVMDMAPNIFGLAVGGSRWGAVTSAIAFGMDVSAMGLATAAEAHATTEQYRRRQQEWSIQRDAAEHECTQLEEQQRSLTIQLEAACLQKDNVAAQQEQTQAQLDFLKTKFNNEALYSWMQGRLSAVFYQFYDLTIARCLKAQLGYQWETQATATFIQPGAWDSNHAGLLCGEALMLNLAQMEAAYLEWDKRALEVNRTVSMALELGEALDGSSFNAEVRRVLSGTPSSIQPHTLVMDTDVLVASINLGALHITNDYPDSVLQGKDVRRIKQLSVSLPALLGPYQDIQAVLGYSGDGGGIHQSCMQTAISHGINDSGQFQLDFNDSKYLPFEGLPIDGGNSATLTLSFPNADKQGKQRAVLESLNDIILHIRYTICASD